MYLVTDLSESQSTARWYIALDPVALSGIETSSLHVGAEVTTLRQCNYLTVQSFTSVNSWPVWLFVDRNDLETESN